MVAGNQLAYFLSYLFVSFEINMYSGITIDKELTKRNKDNFVMNSDF